MSRLQAAVIGVGFVGRAHVEALRRLGVPVVGLLGSSPERSEATRAALGLPRAYHSLEELCSDHEVEVVHVCTPNHLHFEEASALLRAGKPVMCEKPVAMNTQESSALIELARLAPSVGLSQPWRFVIVEDEARRTAIRENFQACNAAALAAQSGERASLYARLKLAGLEEAPGHLAVFADRSTAQGHGLGRHTMPEMIEYSAVTAVHTVWLAARAQGIGMGWVSILDPQAVAVLLHVPLDWKFIGYFCLGYPQADDTTPELEQSGWECRRLPSSVIIRR